VTAGNANRPWTAKEDDQLRAMLAAGKSVAAISVRQKRTTTAIKARAQSLGISVAIRRLARLPDAAK